MEFRLLGRLEVVADGHTLSFDGSRVRVLLALLLLHRNEVVTVDRIVDDLWAERPPKTAEQAVRVYISNLRKALEPGRSNGSPQVLVTRGNGYLLTVAPGELDVERFDARREEGRRLLAAGDAAGAAEAFNEALALWRGPPLQEFAYEGFASAEIARLDDLRLTTLEDRFDAQLAAGEGSELVADLTQLVEENPLRERLRAQLMLALYRSGRQADALETYQRGQWLLAEELGIEPGEAIRHLETQILQQDPALDTANVPPWSTDGTSNLPFQLTAFIGREVVLEKLDRLLQDNRLASIVGPGGSGKTRLALEVGTSLVERRERVWLVDLSPLRDPVQVTETIAQVLSVRDVPPRPLVERVARSIGDGALVLLVDNCEHVIDEAAKVIEALLHACPNLRILSTSREPLSIAGERIERLAPLSLPDPDAGTEPETLIGSEAIRLFCDRAATHDPEFTLDGRTAPSVRSICEHLDGIPLAIELAAARLRSMPVSEVATRLSDRFALLTIGSRTANARQRTLESSISWSYDLLTDAERSALNALSVFVGSFDGEGAVAMIGDQLTASDIVGSLVDQSLIQLEPHGAFFRYRLLETIREFAMLRLSEKTEDLASAQNRHTEFFEGRYDWYGHLGPTVEEGKRQQQRWPFERLDVLVAAQVRLSEKHPSDRSLFFLADVANWVEQNAGFNEGLRLTTEALASAGERSDPVARAILHAVRANAQILGGEAESAREDAYQAIALARGRDDLTLTLAISSLALSLDTQSGLANAEDVRREVVELATEVVDTSGSDWAVAWAHWIRGMWNASGSPEQRREDMTRALQSFQGTGSESNLRNALATLEADLGEFERAKALMRESAETTGDNGPAVLRYFNYMSLSFLESVCGTAADASQSWLKAIDLAEELDMPAYHSRALLYGGLALSCGGRDEAAALLHGAATRSKLVATEFPKADRLQREADLARLTDRLGAARLEALLAQGSSLSYEEAVGIAERELLEVVAETASKSPGDS